MEMILNIAACIALILFGLYAFAQPKAAAAIGHLTPNDGNGLLEIRVNFGALSLALGVVPLLLNQAVVYQTVGAVFLLVLISRLVSVALDRPALTGSFISTAAFELVVGLILILN